MLDKDFREILTELLSKMECKVQLPVSSEEFFSSRGVVPAIPGDGRRFVRFHNPGKAILDINQSLPSVARIQSRACVLTSDISRGGISFLYFEQLFPCERAVLWLPIGRRSIEITSCRRMGTLCYRIGCQFTGATHSSDVVLTA